MDKALFFDRIRQAPFKGRMSASQVSGTEALLAAMQGWPTRWVAYGLATPFHEVGGTMQPVRETFAQSDAAAVKALEKAWRAGQLPSVKTPYWRIDASGFSWFGRGYPQTTHNRNYLRAERETGIPFTKDPSLMLVAENAALVMRRGMEEGWFTGRKLSDYLSDTKSDYRGARRIINGADKADLIAGYALAFEAALRAAGYGKEAPVIVKNTPMTPKSRTAQGAGTAAAGGAIVTVEAITNAAETLQKADGHLSAGTIIQVIIGVLIIAGAAYALYARWSDGRAKGHKA
jgi:hypothetical protein